MPVEEGARPCPFCNRTTGLDFTYDWDWPHRSVSVRVSCLHCRVDGPLATVGKRKDAAEFGEDVAVRLWNDRGMM